MNSNIAGVKSSHEGDMFEVTCGCPSWPETYDGNSALMQCSIIVVDGHKTSIGKDLILSRQNWATSLSRGAVTTFVVCSHSPACLT